MKSLTAIQQECMRKESWQYNIEKKTFTTLCVGEHRKQDWLVWVRDQIEPCFLTHCGIYRDGEEVKGEIIVQLASRWLLTLSCVELWAWKNKLCESAP